MTPAIVGALTTVHLGLAFVLFFAFLGLGLGLRYRRICRDSDARKARRDARRQRVEEDPWSLLPEKWQPPVAESHPDERRAA